MPALESSSLHSTIFRKSQVLVFTPQSSHLLLISLKIMQTTVTLLCQEQKGKTAYCYMLQSTCCYMLQSTIVTCECTVSFQAHSKE